jgi:hypothetical protein
MTLLDLALVGVIVGLVVALAWTAWRLRKARMTIRGDRA